MSMKVGFFCVLANETYDNTGENRRMRGRTPGVDGGGPCVRSLGASQVRRCLCQFDHSSASDSQRPLFGRLGINSASGVTLLWARHGLAPPLYQESTIPPVIVTREVPTMTSGRGPPTHRMPL